MTNRNRTRHLTSLLASSLVLAVLIIIASLMSGCGRCQSFPMPSDESYVEGCGCVANPDKAHVHPPQCGSSPYSPYSPYPTTTTTGSGSATLPPKSDASTRYDAGTDDARIDTDASGVDASEHEEDAETDS